MKDTVAAIYFWDHFSISPCVVIDTGGRLAELVNVVLSTGDVKWSPGRWAAHIAGLAIGSEMPTELRNAPGGETTVGTMLSRIHARDQVYGNCGTLIFDIAADELQVYGGHGLWPKKDFNMYEVRFYKTTEEIGKMFAADQPAAASRKTKRKG